MTTTAAKIFTETESWADDVEDQPTSSSNESPKIVPTKSKGKDSAKGKAKEQKAAVEEDDREIEHNDEGYTRVDHRKSKAAKTASAPPKAQAPPRIGIKITGNIPEAEQAAPKVPLLDTAPNAEIFHVKGTANDEIAAVCEVYNLRATAIFALYQEIKAKIRAYEALGDVSSIPTLSDTEEPSVEDVTRFMLFMRAAKAASQSSEVEMFEKAITFIKTWKQFEELGSSVEHFRVGFERVYEELTSFKEIFSAKFNNAVLGAPIPSKQQAKKDNPFTVRFSDLATKLSTGPQPQFSAVASGSRSVPHRECQQILIGYGVNCCLKATIYSAQSQRHQQFNLVFDCTFHERDANGNERATRLESCIVPIPMFSNIGTTEACECKPSACTCKFFSPHVSRENCAGSHGEDRRFVKPAQARLPTVMFQLGSYISGALMTSLKKVADPAMYAKLHPNFNSEYANDTD